MSSRRKRLKLKMEEELEKEVDFQTGHGGSGSGSGSDQGQPQPQPRVMMAIPSGELKIWKHLWRFTPQRPPDAVDLTHLAVRNGLFILNNLRLAYIFGTTAILVTTDDEAYLLGEHDYFRKVQELSGKRVKEFVSGGGTNCFALTEDGHVYSWGSNNATHQLGLGFGFKNGSPSPRQVLGSLEGKRVIQLAGCEGHALALTGDGEVHGWGDHSNGQLGSVPWADGVFFIAPHLVEEAATTMKDRIVGVAVMDKFSVVLTESGEVIRWGSDGQGQGRTRKRSKMEPKVRFRVPKFKMIVSSLHKIVALSVDGLLYTIDKDLTLLPFRDIENKLHQVVDVAGDPKVELCAFKTIRNQIYVWGNVGGQITERHCKAKATLFGEMDEAFATYWGKTYRTLKAKPVVVVEVDGQPKKVQIDGGGEDGPGVAIIGWNSTENLMQEGDVEIVVDGRRIRAHKSILKSRSKYFERYFEHFEKREMNIERPIYVPSSWAAFKGRLHYFYCNELLYSAHDYGKIFDLMRSAKYGDELDLVKKCEDALVGGLTTENALLMFRRASIVNALELEKSVFNFIFQNRIQIVDEMEANHKDFAYILGKEALVKLVVAFMKH